MSWTAGRQRKVGTSEATSGGERRRPALVALLAALLGVLAGPAARAERTLLAASELLVLGIGLRVEPATQAVPPGIPTVVRTSLVAAGQPDVVVPLGNLPSGMRVRAELRGPGIATPLALECAPGGDLSVPALATRGTYRVENVRLMQGDATLMLAAPSAVELTVQDVLLSSVTSRPLSLDEIRERGIVLDASNFQVLNFTALIAVGSRTVPIEIPMVFPREGRPFRLPDFVGPMSIGPTADLPPTRFEQDDLPAVEAFELGGPPDLETSERGFAIAGMLAFPQSVGFLNQFSSVLLIVSNGAPEASSLRVENLTATYTLPAGKLGRIRTVPMTAATAPVPVRNAGPDGRIGTADDISVLAVAMSGSSELVTQGLEEGTHRVVVHLAGTLSGLPSGIPVPLTGDVSGVVLVRNPSFNLTFLIPGVVEEGHEFEMSTVLTNTGPAPANLTSIRMSRSAVSGAVLLSDELQVFETIPPNESATARFRLRALVTGKVAASRFNDPTRNVQGRFELQVGIGDNGIPTSPEVLQLPDVAYELPSPVVDALLDFLGSAWSNATAPMGSLPPGMPQVPKGAVVRAAVQVADAGQRLTLGEDLTSVLSNLIIRYAGGEQGSAALDQLRRMSVRWPNAADAIAEALRVEHERVGGSLGGLATRIATTHYYDAPLLLAALEAETEGAVRLDLEDVTRRHLGGEGAWREIPTGELLTLDARRQLALVAVPWSENVVRIEAVAGGTSQLTLVVPHATTEGPRLRRVSFPSFTLGPDGSAEVRFDPESSAYTLVTPDGPLLGTVTAIEAPPLALVSARVATSMDAGHHVIALQFNRPVEAASALRAANYAFLGDAMGGQVVIASVLQTSGRFVVARLRNPVPPEPLSQVRASNVRDAQGQLMPESTIAITVPPSNGWGTVGGTAIDGRGRPIAGVRVFLEETVPTTFGGGYSLLPTAQAVTDAGGRFKFWYARRTNRVLRLWSHDPRTDEIASAYATLRNDREDLLLDLRYVGRGDVHGRVVDENGLPYEGALVTGQGTIDSGFDQVFTAAGGQFQLGNLAVGTVNLSARTRSGRVASSTVVIPAAGALVNAGDLRLLRLDRGAVQGRVTSNAAPVQGAPVVVFSDGTSPSWGNWTLTGADGTYRVTDVPVGHVDAEVRDPLNWAQSRASRRGDLANGETLNLDLAYASGSGTVGGLLLDGMSRPVAGATVDIAGLIQVVTGQSGRFTATDIPLGGGNVSATSGGRSVTSSFELSRNGQEVDLLLRLPAFGTLHVHVFDPDEVEVPGAVVRVRNRDYTCTTGATGCSITQLAIGTYTLDVVHSNGSSNPFQTSGANAEATIRLDGDERTVDIHLPSRFAIHGHTYEEDPSTVLGGAVVRLRALAVDGDGELALLEYPPVTSHPTTGEYTIADVMEGPYFITATQPLITTRAEASGQLAADAEVDLVFGDDPLRTLTVHVLMPDGVPAPDDVEQLRLECHTGLPLQEARGQDHQFQVPREYSVIARWVPPSGRGFHGRYAGSLSGDQTITMRMGGLGTVRGVVADDAGPVAEAMVRLRASGRTGEPPLEDTVLSAADGTFEFTEVPEGVVSVRATKSPNAGVTSGSVAHDGSIDLVVRFAPVREVQGTVLTEDSLPAAGVTVLLKEFLWGGGSGAFTQVVDGNVTAADGTFALGPAVYLPTGTGFRVSAMDLARGRSASRDVVVTSASGPVELRLGALGACEGFVLDSDGTTPITGTSVDLDAGGSHVEMPGLTLHTSVDPASGFYVMEGVPEGPFTAEASKPATYLEARGAGSIRSEGDRARVDLRMEAHGSVSGLVSRDGTPVTEATVHLRHANHHQSVSTSLDPADHTFLFRDVPLGVVRLEAETSDLDFAAYEGSLTLDGEALSVDLPLRGFATLTVRALDEDNQPAPGTYEIRVTHGRTDIRNDTSVETFTGVRRGPVSVWVRGVATGNQGTATVEIGPTVSELTLDVPIGAVESVTGHVVGADGATPVARAVVTLSSGGDLYLRRADAEGSFTFEHVRAEGQLQLDAEPVVGAERGRRRATWGAPPGAMTLDVRLDSTPAELLSSTPARDAVGVSLTLPEVVLLFSEPMDGPSLAGRVLLDGATVAPERLSVAGATVHVAMAGPLASHHTYTLLLRRAVENANGLPLASDVAVSFTSHDDIQPTAALALPAPNAENVPVGTSVELLFSEPMDGATIAAGAALQCAAGTPVSGTLDPVGRRRVTFPPPLPVDALCTVTVTAAARDLAGNFAPPATFTFRSEDTVAPALTGIALDPDQAEYTEGSLFEARGLPAAGVTDIVRIDYFANGVWAATATASPFAADVEVPAIATVGGSTFDFTAVAMDDAGNPGPAASREVTISSDVPPAVQIVQPFEGQQFDTQETIEVVVQGADASGLAQLRFFVDGLANAEGLVDFPDFPRTPRTLEGSFTAPENYAAGEIVIQAQGIDRNGNVGVATSVRVSLLETSVEGIVKLPDDVTPAPGVSVTLTRSAETFTGTTDANGHYRIGLTPGAGLHALFVEEATGRRVRAPNLAVATGDTLALDVTLGGAGQISGTVSLAGQPFTGGAPVRIAGLDWEVTGTAAADGTFALERVPAENLNLTATSPPTGFVGPGVNQSPSSDGFVLTGQALTLRVPVVSSRVPASGPVNQAVSVSVNGSWFATGGSPAEVRVDGVLTTPTFRSQTQIVVPLAAHPAGTVTIEIRNPDGGIATTTYTYTSGDLGRLLAGDVREVFRKGDRLFAVGGEALVVLEKVEALPPAPGWVESARINLPGVGILRDAALAGDWIFASYGKRVRVFDVRLPDSPVLYETPEDPTWNAGAVVAAGEGEAWVAFENRMHRLRAFESGGTVQLQELGRTYLGLTIDDAALSDNRLYVASRSPTASNEGALRVFDVSDPDRPALLGERPGQYRRLEVAGNRAVAYLDSPKTVEVLDVSVPNDITRLSGYTVSAAIDRLSVSGNRAYFYTAAAAPARIRVLNLANGQILGSELINPVESSPTGAKVLGTSAFVYGWTSYGVHEFAVVANPRPPAPLALTRWASPPEGGVRFAIRGTDFAPGASVTIDGMPATVLLVTETVIVAEAPAHAAAAGLDVVVENTWGGTGTLGGAFTYTTEPRFFGIAPAQDGMHGGRELTVDGINLAGASLRFGSLDLPVTGGRVIAPAGTLNQLRDVSITPGAPPPATGPDLRVKGFRSAPMTIDLEREGPFTGSFHLHTAAVRADGTINVAATAGSTRVEVARIRPDGSVEQYGVYPTTTPGAESLAFRGDLLFLSYEAAGVDGVRVIDPWTTPPTVVRDLTDAAFQAAPGDGGAGKIVIDGNRLYTSRQGCVFDIAALATTPPTKLGCLGRDLWDFHVDGGVLAENAPAWIQNPGGTRYAPTRFRFFDMTSPASPLQLGEVEVDRVEDMRGSGRRLLLSRVMSIVDFSDPAAPVLSDSFSFPSGEGPTYDNGRRVSPVLIGDRAFASTNWTAPGFHWHAFDVTDPGSVQSLGHLAVRAAPNAWVLPFDGSALGSRLLVTWLDRKAWIVDTEEAGTPPVIHTIEPATGAPEGGTSITIRGRSFSPLAEVRFGTVTAATVEFRDADTLRVRTPPGSGSPAVTVVNPGALVSNPVTFTYATGAPRIEELVPRSGPIAGGTTLRIRGSGFTGLVGVVFRQHRGGVPFETTVPAAEVVATATELELTVPAAPADQVGSADVEVVTSNGATTSVAAWVYEPVRLGTDAEGTNGRVSVCGGVLYYSLRPDGYAWEVRTYDMSRSAEGFPRRATFDPTTNQPILACSNGRGFGEREAYDADGLTLGTYANPWYSATSDRNFMFAQTYGNPLQLRSYDVTTLQANQPPLTAADFACPSQTSVVLDASRGRLVIGCSNWPWWTDLLDVTDGGLEKVHRIAQPPAAALGDVVFTWSTLPPQAPQLVVHDVQDLGSPVELGTYPVRYGHVVVTPERLFSGNGSTLEVWDRPTPTTLAFAGRIQTPVPFTQFEEWDGYLVLNSGPTFLQLSLAPRALEVAAVEPPQGPVAGGQEVLLRGVGLDRATQVTFGGTPATSLHVVSPTELSLITPAHASPQSVSVVVQAPGESDSAAFLYEAGQRARYMNPLEGAFTGSDVWIGLESDLGTLAATFGGQPATAVREASRRAKLTLPRTDHLGPLPITLTADGAPVTLSGEYTLIPWSYRIYPNWDLLRTIAVDDHGQLLLGTNGDVPNLRVLDVTSHRAPQTVHDVEGEYTAYPLLQPDRELVLFSGQDASSSERVFMGEYNAERTSLSVTTAYSSWARDAEIAGGLTFLTTAGGLQSFDLSRVPPSLTARGTRAGSAWRDALWRDGKLYAAQDSGAAIQLLDVSDPSNMSLPYLAQLNGAPAGYTRTTGLLPSGGTLYTEGWRYNSGEGRWYAKLLAVDPDTLAVQGSADLPPDVDREDYWEWLDDVGTSTLVRSGNTVWVASNAGIFAFDVSNPVAPVRAPALDLGAGAHYTALTASDGILYAVEAMEVVRGFPLGTLGLDGDSIRPVTGAAGALVTITGWGFRHDTAVEFGAGVPATFVRIVGPNRIQCRAPSGLTGTVDVKVKTGTLEDSTPLQYTYN